MIELRQRAGNEEKEQRINEKTWGCAQAVFSQGLSVSLDLVQLNHRKGKILPVKADENS